MRRGGFYPGHAGVIGLKLITILKDIGSFFVEGLSLLGQTQLISFSEKRLIPNSISRSRIAMEMVGWVTYNSSAAFVMLWQRLAVQK